MSSIYLSQVKQKRLWYSEYLMKSENAQIEYHMPKDQLVFLQMSSEVAIQRLKLNCRNIQNILEIISLLSDNNMLIEFNETIPSFSIEIEENTCTHRQSGSLLLTVRTKQPTLLPIRDIRIITNSLYDAELSLEVGTICFGGMDPEQFNITDNDIISNHSNKDDLNHHHNNNNYDNIEQKTNFESKKSNFNHLNNNNIRLISELF
ncbi:Collagen alpha chain [Schistosoma japonicum]|nr:Collagen alpha chain [Schistosoma japonicum]